MCEKMVHISSTVHAMAKLFTPMCSPRGADHQKHTGLLIGTCLRLLEITILTSPSVAESWWLKWFTSPQLYML